MKKVKKMFDRIVIVGVGLIGGSIGLAVKKRGLAKEVVGLCRRSVSGKKALEAGAVDIATLNCKEALKGADLVVIATTVGKIVDIAKNIKENAQSKTIVTDAGSTKVNIVRQADKMFKNTKNIAFVGSHPMAGSEKTGVLNASKELFNDSICIITPSKFTNNKALSQIKRFWEALGCDCKVLSPKSHDKYVSQISHIPHIMSSCIANNVDKKALVLQGTGYKDMTRLAKGDPGLWKDIIFSNSKNIIKDLRAQKRTIDKIIKIIEKGKEKELVGFLQKAQKGT